MDKKKLELIISNLEYSIQSLKEELQLENKQEYSYEEIANHVEDYDEIFDDEAYSD